ncbi:protein of unknown function DUF1538 [Methanolobus psychrophilus R15]|nr:protein of unknown function DUF1538 [Methanolobus psychrophilus R15]
MLQDFKETFKEVVQAVLPLTAAVLLIMVVIGLNSGMFLSFFTGAIMVIAGMVFFLMGVKLGMLPIGESIGSELPKHNSLIFIVGVAFLLSFMATLAEPDVRVLSTMIDSVSENGYYNYLREEGKKAIDYVVDIGLHEEVKVDAIIIKDKKPVDAIIDFAAENDIDLIIMGTQGKTGVERALLGSVAENVVRYAKKPVLVIPSSESKEAAPIKETPFNAAGF